MNNFIIFLHITNSCNYMCEYCSVGLPYDSNTAIWNISLDLVKYINYMIGIYLSEFKVYIYILGGEPLLHPYLAQIIHVFESNKCIKELIIMTNNSIDIDNIFTDKISIPIYFSFSFHIDIIKKKFNYERQIDIFINNIKKLKNIVTNFCYRIEILYNMEYSLLEFTKTKNLLTKHFDKNKILLNPIHSTRWYNSNTDNIYYTNPVFNQKIAVNSFFTIIYNTGIDKYCIINDCGMVHTMTSLYDIRFWKNIARMYSKQIICNNKICTCCLCQSLSKIKG